MIEERDLERLKEIFVTRKECQTNLDSADRKFANNDKRLVVIETYQRIQLWILAGVGGGVITMLVKMFFGEV